MIRLLIRLRLVFACASLCAAAAALAEPLPGADACVERIEQARASGREDTGPPTARNETATLGELCPDVAAALDASAWAETVPTDASDLPLEQFSALVGLMAAYERPTARPGLALESLDAVIAEVASKTPPPQLSLWERLRRWLDEWLDDRRGGHGWLEEWLKNLSLPERWVRALVITLGVLLVIAAVAVVANEIAALGVLGRRPARPRFAEEGGGADPEVPRVSSLDDVRRAPLARQPGLLLALVVGRLRKRAPLPDSLTHRELAAAAAPLLGASRRTAFAAVVGAAERATFGAWQPEARDLDTVLASGAAVLDALAEEDERFERPAEDERFERAAGDERAAQ
ncbi:MAG TPA: hypothetical protein VFV10_03575 [Gammaproteobacteria bacterium]|nr:hypothetical protein [Gammaproteobacteria bacterium]